jgi:GNAT superfamily N-acetyltransferase
MDGDHEIGFLGLHEEDGKYLIDSIYVSYEHQRQGIATAMAERAKEITGGRHGIVSLITEEGKAFALTVKDVELEIP